MSSGASLCSTARPLSFKFALAAATALPAARDKLPAAAASAVVTARPAEGEDKDDVGDRGGGDSVPAGAGAT